MIDFDKLVTGGIGREGGLNVVDIAADFGNGGAVVLDVLTDFLEEGGGYIVVVDDQRGFGIAGAHVVDSGFEEEGDIVFVQLLGTSLDSLSVDFINLFEGVGAKSAELLSLHGFYFGFFTKVLDALVVDTHQFVDVGIALFGGLGYVDHGFHDGHATLVDALAETGAVEKDLAPGFVAVGIAFLFVELLVERDIADAGDAVVRGVTPFALCFGGAAHADGYGRDEDNFQVFHD